MHNNPFHGYEPSRKDLAEREGKRWRRAIDLAQRVAGEHAGDVASKIGRYVANEGRNIRKRAIGECISIRWYRSYGATKVSVLCSGGEYRPFPESVCSQVWGRNKWTHFPPEAKVDAANVYQDIMERAVPGIQVEKAIQFCDGICDSGERVLKTSPLTYSIAAPSMCQNFGDHWLCEDCEELARAGQPGAGDESGSEDGNDEKSHAERVRADMTPGKRFDILQRDDFTCQTCGSEAPDVDLEVDHIKPVSKGGTNDPDNLQALCADCNRGKSDKRVTQMEMV